MASRRALDERELKRLDKIVMSRLGPWSAYMHVVQKDGVIAIIPRGHRRPAVWIPRKVLCD